MTLTSKSVSDDDPRDTRPRLKDTHVIIDVRVREGNTMHGWKEYVSKDLWNGSAVDRKAIIDEVSNKLIKSLERDR